MKKMQFLFFNQLKLFLANYLGSPRVIMLEAWVLIYNPQAVDGRFKFDLNLFSLNFSAYQNFAHFDTRGMDKWWVKSFSPDETVTINPDGSETTSYSTEIGGSNPYNVGSSRSRILTLYISLEGTIKIVQAFLGSIQISNLIF